MVYSERARSADSKLGRVSTRVLGLELNSRPPIPISRGQDMREHTLAESVAVAIKSREVDRKVL